MDIIINLRNNYLRNIIYAFYSDLITLLLSPTPFSFNPSMARQKGFPYQVFSTSTQLNYMPLQSYKAYRVRYQNKYYRIGSRSVSSGLEHKLYSENPVEKGKKTGYLKIPEVI